MRVDKYRDRLAIDGDALGDCLVEQPQLKYDVSTEYVQAVSLRDAAKMDLDELRAVIDKDIRARADASAIKMTEARIDGEVVLDPRYKAKRREILELSEQADRLQVLRDGFVERSFMLRELVALQISERADIARANGAGQQRPMTSPLDALAESNRRGTEEARQRFRPRRKLAE